MPRGTRIDYSQLPEPVCQQCGKLQTLASNEAKVNAARRMADGTYKCLECALRKGKSKVDFSTPLKCSECGKVTPSSYYKSQGGLRVAVEKVMRGTWRCHKCVTKTRAEVTRLSAQAKRGDEGAAEKLEAMRPAGRLTDDQLLQPWPKNADGSRKEFLSPDEKLARLRYAQDYLHKNAMYQD